MNKEDHLCVGNDLNLNNIINNKIKTEYDQQFLVVDHDQPPPFYSLSPEIVKNKTTLDKTITSTKYHDYLDDKAVLNSSLNNELDCKFNQLNKELNKELNTELNTDQLNIKLNMPAPTSLFTDLYTVHNQNITNVTDNLHCTNNSQFYQQQNTDSSLAVHQQSIMINNNKVSLFNNQSANTLKLPFEHNLQQQKPIIYQVNQQSSITSNLDQQINEIYQYAASDQLSKSSTIESDAAYSTLKLLDTVSCNSSLVGGINNLTNNDQLIKGYPPTYTSSNFMNNGNEQNKGLRIESETDSGYTFNSQNSNSKPTLTNLISDVIENDYIHIKNQLNSPINVNQMNHQINQLNHQLNSQINQQLNSECLYQPSNFVRSRTTVDLLNPSCSLDNSMLNSSASTYSFVNLPNCLPNDHLLHSQQYSTNNSYLTYQPQINQIPSDITVLSSTPIPCSSTKEAMIQQQLNNNSTNLVIMTNCSADSIGQTNLPNNNSTVNNHPDSIWYKLISRRLRERFISKRKVQDSSFSSKKSKLEQLDSCLDDKRVINTSTNKSLLNLFYQLFLFKRCSLVPCLLIFACALLLFIIGLFTILTCYFKNQQQNLLLNDHLLLTNSHTQLQGNSINKLNQFNIAQQSTTQQTNSPSQDNFAIDAFNKFVFGLTSIVKSIAFSTTSTNGLTNSISSMPNSLTTGESTPKHTVHENQIKFKQHQTNHWYKSAIFYEIFPASYQDSNGDGIGDIDGIISRLSYIKELGVTVIRLNSIFSALDYPYQFSNILNHTQIEKQLGTMNDFRRLVKICHNTYGLRIVLDLNPCITSDQHQWAAHFLNYLNKTNDSHNFYVNTSDYVSIF